MGAVRGDFGDFEVWVYAPPREYHRRPHVHLIRAEHEVSIALPAENRTIVILEFTKGMPAHLIRKAARIVEDNAQEFRKEWDKLHENAKKAK